MHSVVQTAFVIISSYKPLSGFASYTERYGSYMPSFPLGREIVEHRRCPRCSRACSIHVVLRAIEVDRFPKSNIVSTLSGIERELETLIEKVVIGCCGATDAIRVLYDFRGFDPAPSLLDLS